MGVGTLLGGIVLMMLAQADAREGLDRTAGLVCNDVGPTIEPAGLQRSRGYVGCLSSHPTWLHAARAVAEANRDVYPDWALAEDRARPRPAHRRAVQGRR